MAHKQGGTFFGNLLQAGGAFISKYAGVPGLLGSGKNRPWANPATQDYYSPSTDKNFGSNSAPAVYGTTWNDNPNNILPGVNISTTPGGSNGGNNLLIYAGIGLAALLLLKRK